jgi:hypothetical protein
MELSCAVVDFLHSLSNNIVARPIPQHGNCSDLLGNSVLDVASLQPISTRSWSLVSLQGVTLC